VLIDVLIYSAAQLQECLVNLLTYLLTYLFTYLHCGQWFSETRSRCSTQSDRASVKSSTWWNNPEILAERLVPILSISLFELSFLWFRRNKLFSVENKRDSQQVCAALTAAVAM